MQIINEVKLDFDDVLIRPKRSKTASRKEVELVRTFTTLNSKKEITGIPIIAANMSVVGCFGVAKELAKLNIFTCLHKFYSVDDLVNFLSIDQKYIFYTLGITNEDIEKLKIVKHRMGNIEKICVDTANGYMEYFQDRVKLIKEICPDSIIMAGNVVTPEMVQELLISGAVDIVKIGLGSGGVCETRKVTGVGYPQLSAVLEASEAAHGLGGLVCSDGGCRNPGDLSKAFGAGSDFVMLGSMLSGHEECEGEWEMGYESQIDSNGVPICTSKQVKKSLKFYGMSSKEAMEKYSGGMSDYRASEGKCVNVPYKGPIKSTIQQILGGIRSTCAYAGAKKLKDLSKCTTFVRLK